MSKLQLKQKSIYFCGIGGIGMSALARISSFLGAEVSGSDKQENKNTIALKEEGFSNINIWQKAENLEKKIDIFVYSSAIAINNPERIKARELNLKIISRGEFLVEIANLFKTKIFVSGTHGKTTTTGFLGFIFESLNLKPTILLGGVLKNYDSNCKISIDVNDFFIAESDESDGSFTSLIHEFGIITSIEEDHMDFYITRENLVSHFRKLARNTTKKLIICNEYEDCVKLGNEEEFKNKVIFYGFSENSNLHPLNIKETKEGFIFDIIYNNNILIENFYLNLPGKHNILNLLAGIAVLIASEINFLKFKEFHNIFKNFSGIENRFHIEGKINNHLIINDYAHNPTKIKSAIDSVLHFKKYNNEYSTYKVILIFEPHRFTRTRDSINGFVEAFNLVDKIIVLDIFAASEKPIEGISPNFITEKLKERYKNREIISLKTDANLILEKIKNTRENCIFLYTSAGNTTLTKEILKLNNERK